MKHEGSASVDFGLADFKAARVISKGLGFFGYYFREDPAVEVVSVFYFVLGAINEDIFFGRMAVKIQENLWFESLSDVLDKVCLIKQMGLVKHSVEISTSNSCSKVTNYYPIDIYHRNNLEAGFVPDVMGLWRAKVLDKAFHHPTSLRLTWVQSSNCKVVLLLCLLGEVRD